MTARLLNLDGSMIGEILYGVGQEPLISDIIDLGKDSFMVHARRFRTSAPKNIGYACTEQVITGLDLTVSPLAPISRRTRRTRSLRK